MTTYPFVRVKKYTHFKFNGNYGVCATKKYKQPIEAATEDANSQRAKAATTLFVTA